MNLKGITRRTIKKKKKKKEDKREEKRGFRVFLVLDKKFEIPYLLFNTEKVMECECKKFEVRSRHLMDTVCSNISLETEAHSSG